ncbi:disintegrin and metalloproteinase domain-containing protein 11-like isoform X2 [Dunckerocampus dactyliophorus]|uniref:disintegrin and metalloproteinase domain-containing protein 11-like isoform X2 n=1 Tax=Dunckerocampus dactyliophorus TaxID=161453 RepID=UPI002404FDC0|nr:disintegrin and metalloproteinase domain-containing protein 11-like isoform X2 [Dunckerocampus dactyliophorus]
MLAVRCFLLFAAVGERLAVSGQDGGGTWNGSSWSGRTEVSDTAAQVTYPKRLVWRIESEEELAHGYIDTRVKNDTRHASPVHLAQSCFQVEAFGRTFTLDLELNHHLLSSKYVERHFTQDGRPSQSMGGEHCYYQGRLRGVAESWAALSTCHGLCGMFSDGIFSYGIEPVHNDSNEENSAHLIHRLPDFRLSPHCADCTEDREWDRRGGDEDRLDQSGGQQQVSGPLRRSKRFARRPSVQTETKYIELMVVNDNDMIVQLRRSGSQTKNFAKAVVNMADAIYKEQLNTRIVLVAMETWTSKNMVQVVEDPLSTLQNFMKYRRDNIREQSDVVQLFSGRTFQSGRSGTAYTGGVCSQTRGGGINEFGNVGAMAITLCQSLGQNIGMRWNNARNSAGDCRCPDTWLGCIMEDTGYYLPRKFSRCSVDEYIQFLLQGGGSCLFNKPNKLLDPPECGNGFVEPGEECDCGSQVECARSGGACCKKCTLTHDAMCSNGLCCSGCKYEQRGVVCREAVNDCDIPETCTGDSSQCPHNVHKLDGYTCESNQGRCYGGRCRTRDGQCRGLWGFNSADRFCYDKLNAEGTDKGNCGRGPGGQGWLQCNKPDVLCGFLFCANITTKPKYGDLQGEVTSFTLYHQNKYLDCRGGHALLEDGSDLGYVEDGTPCGPNMMCLERRCLPVAAFNLSTCAGSNSGRICSDHGTCSNEVKCICHRDYTGKDCSVFDPIPEPTVLTGPEKKDLVEDKMSVFSSCPAHSCLLLLPGTVSFPTLEKKGTAATTTKCLPVLFPSLQSSSCPRPPCPIRAPCGTHRGLPPSPVALNLFIIINGIESEDVCTACLDHCSNRHNTERHDSPRTRTGLGLEWLGMTVKKKKKRKRHAFQRDADEGPTIK